MGSAYSPSPVGSGDPCLRSLCSVTPGGPGKAAPGERRDKAEAVAGLEVYV